MYTIKNLVGVPSAVIACCFNEAFSDYSIPMAMTAQKIDDLFLKSQVDRSLSFGTFDGDKMVGFIFNASANYSGYQSIFDVGTAILPKYRHAHVFSRLFDRVIKAIEDNKIDRYYLEVLQDNNTAIKIYQHKGFKITRQMVVCLAPTISASFKLDGEIKDLLKFKSELTRPRTVIEPSFEHCDEIILTNHDIYQVICNYQNGLNYCVYDRNKGHIVRIGYDDLMAIRGLVGYLTTSYPGLMIKNVAAQHQELLTILWDLGYQKTADQYEMVKIINCVYR